MMSSTPFVSVIIPCHNRSTLAERAIRSVLGQTYKNYELLIVDDGSSEDFSAIKTLAQEHSQKYFIQKHTGVAAARNFGIRESQGELLFLLDSDDEWLPRKLEKQVDYFAHNPQCMLVQTREKWFRFGNPVQIPKHLQPGTGDCFLRALKMCCVSSSSIGFRRSLVEAIGYYDEKLRVCEDYDFWLRALLLYEVELLDSIEVVKYSGTHEQLSNSEVALDRYRLMSLVSLLNFIKAKGITISQDRKQAIIETIRSKTRILLDGAMRRKIEADVKVYRTLSKFNFDNDNCNVLNSTRQMLEITLNYRPKVDQIRKYS